MFPTQLIRAAVVVLCVAIASLVLLRGRDSQSKWRRRFARDGESGGGATTEQPHSTSNQLGDRWVELGDAQSKRCASTVLARGRAPRTCWRTDERVREDICDRLMMNHHIDVRDVSVAVREGIVILEGSVPERRMRYLIEDLAADCMNAIDVENRIRVTKLD
jgi:hypothetical protein